MNRADTLAAATTRLQAIVERTLDAAANLDTEAYDLALADAVAWSSIVTALRFGGTAPIVVEVAR